MIITIFDIDGTICDSREIEGVCFVNAIENVTGITLSTLEWTEYPEPTSSGIVRGLLKGDPASSQKEMEIKHEYCRLLGEARLTHPEEFMPIPGVHSFIKRLQDEGISTIAIATGCFDDEARFKLECCGMALDEYPHATSSDTPRRRDILPLAAARAGGSTADIVYFGDAPWDFAVSRVLPVHLIGIGRRILQLTELGLEHTFPDFQDHERLLGALSDFSDEHRPCNSVKS
jgi:beta-phosphoglucomutase-like phosphatase (HAD superfamily)